MRIVDKHNRGVCHWNLFVDETRAKLLFVLLYPLRKTLLGITVSELVKLSERIVGSNKPKTVFSRQHSFPQVVQCSKSLLMADCNTSLSVSWTTPVSQLTGTATWWEPPMKSCSRPVFDWRACQASSASCRNRYTHSHTVRQWHYLSAVCYLSGGFTGHAALWLSAIDMNAPKHCSNYHWFV